MVMSHLNCSGCTGRSYHLGWGRHKRPPVTPEALNHAVKYKCTCLNLEGQTGSVSYPPLGKILNIFLITVNQYFGEEFYAVSIMSYFSEVKTTTLTYPSSESGIHWLPGAPTSTPSCSHAHTGLTPSNFHGIYTMQAKHEQSLTLNTQKTMGISYLRVEHGAKTFEGRGPRLDTQTNQNYSSHG